MKYISVCSGIEAVSVAWHDIMRPRAFCEFEAFPSAVLAHHYPEVPNLGDLTKWRDWDQDILADADILVGGTPCQAFSVAGLRASLADDRGNLSLEFVRLANAIDNVRSAAGREPGIVLWENVPGVLSVRDNAFGCFLAALVGQDTPLVPTGGKWTDAGVVAGPKRTVAWRIFDAQYFGVAQRRRRVFVCGVAVGHPRAWAIATSFFPLEQGLRRDSAPRRETRQDTAAGAPDRAGGGGPAVDFRHESLTGETVHTLQSKSTGGYSLNYMPGVIQQPVCMAHGQANAEIRTDGKQWPADIAPTLNAHFGEKQGLEDQHALGGAGLFVPAVANAITSAMANSPTGHNRDENIIAFDAYNQASTGDVSKTVASRDDQDTASLIAAPVIFATDGQSNAAFAEDVALTLNATNEQPYIAAPQIVGALTAKGPEAMGAPEVDGHHYLAVTHSLRGEGFDASEDGTGRGTPLVPVAFYSNEGTHEGKNNFRTRNVMAFSCKDSGNDVSEDISPTLRSMANKDSTPNGGGQVAVAIPFDTTQITSPSNYSKPKEGDPCRPLAAGAHPPAVAFSIMPQNSGKDYKAREVEVAQPIMAGGPVGGNQGGDYILQPTALAVSLRGRDGGGTAELGGDIQNALRASQGVGDKPHVLATCFDDPRRFTGPHGGFEHGDLHPTLESTNPKQIALQHMAVRRLTPVECERLQGFPDDYTNIPWRKQPTAPDGPRYKALGNSMAVPVMRWIGVRILKALES